MKSAYWFSPVPPSRTDIAQYSVRVVSHLTSLINLEVIRPSGTPKGDLLSRSAADLTIRELNSSRVCIYNVGNNPIFHGEILKISMRNPGVVVLHDRVIHDLCFDILDYDRDNINDGASYRAAMSYWYGRAGKEAARAALAGETTVSQIGKNFPLFEVAIRNALGVITHNQDITDEITERFPGLPVATLRLPYDNKIPAVQDHSVQRSDSPIRLMMFGYLNPNRRLSNFLQAWTNSPWRHRFHLDLAGEIYNRPEITAIIAETGLANQIQNHGFLPDNQLDALINQAHLVLNLRNPTMGEASGSQLRIWANGAASVVSNTGWYAQLPSGSALRVGIETEHSDLLTLLDDLAESRIDLAAIALRGKECLKACDPASYALELTEWLKRESESMSTRWFENALIEAAAGTYGRCAPPGFVPKLPERLLQ